MKRILTILAATLLLTAAMAGTASASSYDSVAEELSAIGVFRGTAGGFELDLVLGLPVTETENAQITAKLQMDMQMDVNATGDDVRISYPSFSNFEDLTPVLSGGEL